MLIALNLLIIFMMSYMLCAKLLFEVAFRVDVLSLLMIQSIVSLGIFKLFNKVGIIIFFTATLFVFELGYLIYLDQTFFTTFIYWLPFIIMVVTFIGGVTYGALTTLVVMGQIYYLSQYLEQFGMKLRSDLTFEKFVDVQMLNHLFLAFAVFLVCIIFDFTRKKMEQNLLQSRKILIENSRTTLLSNLFAGLSHEINNPLCAIRFANDVIRMSLKKQNLEDEKVIKMMSKIDSSIDKAAHVVSALKSISGNDSEKQFTDISIQSLAAEVESMFKTEMINKEIEFSISSKFKDDDIVHGEKSKIIEAVINLVENAIYAVEKLEDKWIKIEFVTTDIFTINVIDAGQGISEQTIDHMFDPFYSTKDVNEGMGLGLTFSEATMKLHNGRVQYSLQDGHTCFSLIFVLGPKSLLS